MLTVKKIMAKTLEKVSIDTTVKDIAGIMGEKSIGSVLVEQNTIPVGIVTETDIVRKVIAQNISPHDTIAGKIMNSPIMTIDSGASIVEATDMMDRHHIRHLVVTEEGNLLGIISVRDLMHPVLLDEESY